jgi:hypothetical protein
MERRTGSPLLRQVVAIFGLRALEADPQNIVSLGDHLRTNQSC